MFSTVLGPLPELPGDAGASGHNAGGTSFGDRLADLESIGLELVPSGPLPAPVAAAPDATVAGWLAAASATERPVKQVLAGPYSAGRDGPPTRPAAAAAALRETIVALAAAGCPFVEIDEPDALAITAVTAERRRFIDAHRKLVDGLSDIHVSLALGGGNLDGAGAATFFDLSYASYAFDLIAGPDNWRLVVAAPSDRGIVCGALNPKPGGDETRELLVWAAHYAASTGGRGLDRVGLANAPGLAALPWEVAVRKLRVVAEATRIAGVDSPTEMASLLDRRAIGRRRRSGGGASVAGPGRAPTE